MLEHLFKSVEVEAIPDVVFVNSREEGMIVEVAEPTDPSVVLLGRVRVR